MFFFSPSATHSDRVCDVYFSYVGAYKPLMRPVVYHQPYRLLSHWKFSNWFSIRFDNSYSIGVSVFARCSRAQDRSVYLIFIFEIVLSFDMNWNWARDTFYRLDLFFVCFTFFSVRCCCCCLSSSSSFLHVSDTWDGVFEFFISHHLNKLLAACAPSSLYFFYEQD